MSLWESFRIGLKAIGTNRLRSFLTMLGIIIGVASVITMVAVGVGAQKQIRALGANVLMVYSTSGADGGAGGSSARHALAEADAHAIMEEVPRVRAAAPFAWSTARIIRGNRTRVLAPHQAVFY